MPAGSRIEDVHVTANHAGAMVTNVQAVVVSAPMAVVEHEETRAKTELGAAQKNTARELTAKLASFKGIVWVGVAMFLFGLATLFYPPLKLIVGSVTTSVAITVGGLALIILPTSSLEMASHLGRRRFGSQYNGFTRTSAWATSRVGGCK